jgi:hypothetical protein
MTPEAQRIAIAEACGWKTEYRDAISSVTALPNYLNDLNAMHEAEKVLTHDQMIDYSRHVGKLVTSHLPASRAAWMDFKLINSTASQRAEAFLRTIGKWKECK